MLHVHWPESSFNHGLLGARCVTTALLAALDLARARGTRCVWTAHNLSAHERRYPLQEQAFWRRFVRRLDGYFALTPAAVGRVRERFPELSDVPSFVIAHPHYRGVYPDDGSRARARLRLGLPANARVLAFLGQILDYKNVPELLGVFRATNDGSAGPLRLLVAGRPRTAALAAAVREAERADPRIHACLEYIPAGEVQHVLRAADVLVLPYREIFNSGSAMLALSFDRPVLMPDCAATRELQSLVGEAWVRAYGALTPRVLIDALAAAQPLPERTDGAWLRACDPARLAASTLRAYAELLAAPAAATRGVRAA